MAGLGTGVPLTFMCAKCRKVAWRRTPTQATSSPYGHNVVRTGRVRALSGYAGRNQPPRTLSQHHEYRCLDCGHVGWSRHVDVLTKPLGA